MHTNYCQSISISFRRWWVKFTNKIHRDKFHWGWGGLKMQFIVSDHLFIMSLAEGTEWVSGSFS